MSETPREAFEALLDAFIETDDTLEHEGPHGGRSPAEQEAMRAEWLARFPSEEPDR